MLFVGVMVKARNLDVDELYEDRLQFFVHKELLKTCMGQPV